MSGRGPGALWLVAGAALALAGCEAPLDPLLSSDVRFSFSGYLDASADTQWVRVEPFGTTAEVPDGPIDAEVWLVLPGGARRPMAQRVRRFATGPAHLFWTTADVEPGRTYAVVARASDGAEARTDVEVPDDAAVTIDLDDGIFTCPTTVTVTGAERLVDVQARYGVNVGRFAGTEFRLSKLPSVRRTDAGGLRAQVFYGDDAVLMEVSPLPVEGSVRPEIVVALGTAAWPDVDGLTLEGALAAASLGRVEGGVGFVGGVVTRRLPFVPGFGRLPFELDPEPPEPCFEAG